jgi:hypothetical protein
MKPTIIKCRHGVECFNLFIHNGGQNHLCSVTGSSIFELPSCPAGKWRLITESAPAPDRKQQTTPGDCKNCPAAAIWEWGEYANQGLLCFHYAYYLGKTGRPKPCSVVKNRCPRRGSMNQWREDELQRKGMVENGYTVVANLRRDNNLIEWGRENDRYVYIGRPTSRPKWIAQGGFNWGNPIKNGSQDNMCDRFAEYFRNNKEMQNHLSELRGKVLLCFCYPKRCHGDTLAAAANGLG